MADSDQSNECEYCHKKLATKYGLKIHQEKTKACLKLQGLLVPTTYKCDFCDYFTGLKTSYTRHLKSCKAKNGYDIKEKIEFQHEIKLLREQLTVAQKTASRPTKQINNNMNVTYNQRIEYSKRILEPYSELKEQFQSLIDEQLTEYIFEKGFKGIIKFIVNKILGCDGKQYYICYDKAGDSFHRKNESDIEFDDKAKLLLDDLYPIIHAKCKKIYVNITERLEEDLKLVSEENKEEGMNVLLQKTREASDRLIEISKLKQSGSRERDYCIKVIADTYYVSRDKMRKNISSNVNPAMELIKGCKRMLTIDPELPIIEECSSPSP